MGVVNYATVNGALMGETGPNGIVNYHTDALGSVTMTTDGSGNVLNKYRYKPYGGLLSKTGTAPDPQFLWLGAASFRQSPSLYASVSYAGRHHSTIQSAWTSADWAKVSMGWSPYSNVIYSTLYGGDSASCNLAFMTGYQVGFKKITTQDAGLCGAWGAKVPYQIEWDLTSLPAGVRADGWIIQEINFEPFSMTNCKNGAPNCSHSLIQYWEGWQVIGGKIFNGRGKENPSDYWKDGRICSCSNGEKTERGFAKFYQVSDGCIRTWQWTVGDATRPRGLLFGDAEPTGWTRTGEVTERHITARAYCCAVIPVLCGAPTKECVSSATTFA